MFDPKYSEGICSEVTFSEKSWSFSVSIDPQMWKIQWAFRRNDYITNESNTKL